MELVKQYEGSMLHFLAFVTVFESGLISSLASTEQGGLINPLIVCIGMFFLWYDTMSNNSKLVTS